MGIGVVADDVAQADVMGAAALLGVGQNGLQRFQIAVNVSKNSKTHEGRAVKV
jgi:hypothetical protein